MNKEIESLPDKFGPSGKPEGQTRLPPATRPSEPHTQRDPQADSPGTDLPPDWRATWSLRDALDNEEFLAWFDRLDASSQATVMDAVWETQMDDLGIPEDVRAAARTPGGIPALLKSAYH